jgi:hypothetical protein
MAKLVDRFGTVTCPQCHREVQTWKKFCPNCYASMNVKADLMDLIVHGELLRPAGSPAFSSGIDCTLTRRWLHRGLVFVGPEGMIEAFVKYEGEMILPLRCIDIDGDLFFSIEKYPPIEDALVALDSLGAPIATYIQHSLKHTIEVRDQASAPVAHMEIAGASSRWAYELLDTNGMLLAGITVYNELVGEEYIDDSWTLRPRTEKRPLSDFAMLGLLLVAKVLYGQAEPTLDVGVRVDRGPI